MLTLLLTSSAMAHLPIFGGGWTTPDTAWRADDPQLSVALYHEVTCDDPAVWVSFDVPAGDDVWVQLGVPVIDRLVDYRPSMAVFGPGLPEVDPEEFPFEVPEGLGAVVFDTTSAVPGSFYEPFTDTDSWVLAEERVTLPEGGPGWAVAWDPDQTTGKLWLAMGEVEDFSSAEFSEMASWMELVNDFHETGEFSPVPEGVEEQVCDAPPAADAAGLDVQQRGCASVPMAPTGLPFLLLLACMAACADRTRIQDGTRMNSVVQLKDWFTSFFLVDAGDEALLVDAGFRAGRATRALEDHGVALADVGHVFLTHGHGDHLGLLPELGGAVVHGLAAEAGLVREETDGDASIDTPVVDGEVVTVGEVDVEVFAVPGHTPGSAAYLIDGVLLLGDSAIVDRDGRLVPVAEKRSDDPDQLVASMKELADFLADRADSIDWLAPSHSAPVQGYGPLGRFPE